MCEVWTCEKKLNKCATFFRKISSMQDEKICYVITTEVNGNHVLLSSKLYIHFLWRGEGVRKALVITTLTFIGSFQISCIGKHFSLSPSPLPFGFSQRKFWSHSNELKIRYSRPHSTQLWKYLHNISSNNFYHIT